MAFTDAEKQIRRAWHSAAASLDLSGFGLSELPASIGSMGNLQALDLSNNSLTQLPRWIGQLTKLRELYIANNHLTTLPPALGQLTRLQVLDVSRNCLTDLPEQLGALSHLRELYLHDNIDLRIPRGVLGPERLDVTLERTIAASPSKLLAYYFLVRSERRPLNMAKLIVVGRRGVGKTSLIERLVHGTFHSLDNETSETTITTWALSNTAVEHIDLNIWDFGSQEILHATHQLFLTGRSLYMLVLSGSEGAEDSDAEYWLDLIQKCAVSSPVIVVLNKITGHAFDLNRRALVQKYNFIQGFIRTDCVDETGLEELRHAIARAACQLDHIRDFFPSAWFTIKDRIASAQTPYMTSEEYRALCAECGEGNHKDQALLAGYLHDLGVAFNFKDDPHLRHLYILDPHWVTNGIHTILNSPRLASQGGDLTLGDIADILDSRLYPGKMHPFLLDLMRTFDLCFRFPDDPNQRYLIPQLLDKQQPQIPEELTPGLCLNFEYAYRDLPDGLLPRFIVRSHVLSSHQLRWRSGVVVELQGSRALIRSDARERKVQISVSGPDIDRRRLLAVIRADFEHIHRDMPGVEVQELVAVPNRPELTVPYKKLVALSRRGSLKTYESFHDDVVELDVRKLLSGIDVIDVQAGQQPPDQPQFPVRVFCSYSHKDESFREELDTHVKLLVRMGLIDSWNDRRIMPGDDWQDKLDRNIESADVVLLLVSADFLSSDYCYNLEMKRALDRHDAGEAHVIPILVREVVWRTAPFARLQVLPRNGRAVKSWEDRDAAWKSIAEEIELLIREIRNPSRLP
jgi:internalin A